MIQKKLQERERDRARAERAKSRKRRLKEVERISERGHTSRDRPTREKGLEIRDDEIPGY